MFSALSKRLRRSISFRLAILFSSTFSLLLILALGFTYFEVSRSLQNSGREVISAKWREIAAIYANDGQKGLQNYLSTDENRVRNLPFFVRILTDEGRSLFIKPALQDGKFDFDQAESGLSHPKDLLGWHSLEAIDDEDRFDILTQPIAENIFLQLGKSSEDREDTLEKIQFVFIVTATLLIVLSTLLGLFYASRALKPIHALSATIRSIENGDLSKRTSLTNSQDELRELGEIFNRMVSRLEKLIVGMKESLDNVAHDIRTPLTRIRIKSEQALLSADPKLQNKALEDCAEGVQDISTLVDQLLDISEAESGAMNLKLEVVDVTALIKEVIEVYEYVAEESGVSILLDKDIPLEWRLDRKRIKQVVANLIDNAIKFSPRDTTINVEADIREESLFISVSDEGFGIPTDELSKIWDRLFRGDKSRSTKGLGLGLSLVRSVVLAHKGTVLAQAREPQGTLFQIVLPIAPVFASASL